MARRQASINNVNDLRDNLAVAFEELKNGTMAPKTAKEISNISGKMIASAKVQLEYHTLRKDEAVKINFLHSKDR